MALVDNHRRPFDAAQWLRMRNNHLIRREHDLELVAILAALCRLNRLAKAPIVRKDHTP